MASRDGYQVEPHGLRIGGRVDQHQTCLNSAAHNDDAFVLGQSNGLFQHPMVVPGGVTRLMEMTSTPFFWAQLMACGNYQSRLYILV